jgi:hypothetical protein
MKQRGQGDQWQIERNPREAIDFELEYPINPIPEAEEVTIFMKQFCMKVRIKEPWTALSDRLVQQFGLPRGSMLRIYPVDGDIQRLGDDDHAYSVDWKDGAQHWFEIVHDLSKYRNNLTRQIRMVYNAGRVESLVIPGNAQIEDVRKLSCKLIDCRTNVVLQCNSHNAEEYYWEFGEMSSEPLVACTLRSPSSQANARIYDGSDPFKADQISRLLDVKVPHLPSAGCPLGQMEELSLKTMINGFR